MSKIMYIVVHAGPYIRIRNTLARFTIESITVPPVRCQFTVSRPV